MKCSCYWCTRPGLLDYSAYKIWLWRSTGHLVTSVPGIHFYRTSVLSESFEASPVSTQVCHAEILLFAVLGLASLATASVFIFGYKLTYFCAFKFNICKLYQVLLNSGYGPAMVDFLPTAVGNLWRKSGHGDAIRRNGMFMWWNFSLLPCSAAIRYW